MIKGIFQLKMYIHCHSSSLEANLSQIIDWQDDLLLIIG